jgi:hypothetical protein
MGRRLGNHYAINCLNWSLVFMYVDWVLLKSPDKDEWRKIQYEDHTRARKAR